MKYFSFIAFVTCILLMGCIDTEGMIELKGKVLDEDTKVTIPRKTIIVQALLENDNKFIPVFAGSFLTDSLGCFEYTLKKVKNVYLYNFCLVGDSAYAYSINKLGLIELKRFGKYLSFNLSKLADLTITLERKSKTPSRDTLYVSWKSDGIDGKILYPYKITNYGMASDIGFRWIGGDIKSIIKTKAYADKKTILRWELFRNGKRKEIIDTVFCTRDVANYVNFIY